MGDDELTRGRPTPIAALAGHFPAIPFRVPGPDPNYRPNEDHLKDLKTMHQCDKNKGRRPPYVRGVPEFEEPEE